MRAWGNCRRALAFAAMFAAPVLLVGLLGTTVTTHAVAAPGPQSTCTDNDGDGYGSPGDPSCPNGGATDCDDTDPSIHPGAAEVCNFKDDDCDGTVDNGFTLSKESKDSTSYDCQDGIDNDGDGLVDSADPDCAVALCTFNDPPACSSGDPGGCCITTASHVCKADGTGTECVLLPGVTQHLQSAEGGGNSSPSCFDDIDNDCDGLTDHQEPSCQDTELCDGFDNDGDGLIDEDFPNKGLPCTVGIGTCQATGHFVCSADKLTTVCSVHAGTPGVEGPPGSPSCSDGLDNDCDNHVDLADTNCQSAEKCDGVDNNGNGLVDETFPDKGTSCTVGVGACQRTGVKVCKADGTGTVCNVLPGVAGVEGPSGPTCSDGIDNDCDGQTDLADTGCGTSKLAVQCALPYERGESGADCTGKHTIQYTVLNGGPHTVVKAELLALNPDGSVAQVDPVQNGDEAHLASRTNLLSVIDKKSAHGVSHQVFAPLPLLRVTAIDGETTATAYCSNVPYLDVLEPNGEVLDASASSTTHVEAAIPRVDPHTLQIQVDGVDIIAGLGLDRSTQLPGGPYTGVVTIGGVSVTIQDLLVDSGDIGTLSSNSVRFDLDGLACGGHIVVISGSPQAGARRNPQTPLCLVDDLNDSGTSMVFSLTIDVPVQGQVTNTIPTPVSGEVCDGQHIASLAINGKSIDTTVQPSTSSNGVSTFKLDFSTTLPQNNLASEVAGLSTGDGTFDPGYNRLVAAAIDDGGNRAYKTLTFSIGNVSTPGSLSAAAQQELAGTMDAAARGAFISRITPLGGTTLHDAFVVGMTKPALSTFFAKTCADANNDAKDAIKNALLGKALGDHTVSVDAACDPVVHSTITDVTFQGDFTCQVDLADNLLTMTAFAPTMVIRTHHHGYCCDGCDFICISEVIIDATYDWTVPKPGAQPVRFAFPIDETTFINGGHVDGQFIHPSDIADPVKVGTPQFDINCLSAVAQVFIAIGKAIVDFFVTVFTFGAVDPPFDLSPPMQDVASAADVNADLQVDSFPATFKGIKPDEQAVADTNKKLTTTPVEAQFTPDGITIILDGEFSSTSTDPDIVPGVVAAQTPAPAPQPPQPGAGNTFFVASDDVLNQMFASMTAQGDFRSICKASGKTVGDFLPADCETITNADPVIGAAIQGACHAIKGDNCDTIPTSGILGTPAEIGACKGTNQDHSVCAGLPVAQQFACNHAPQLNLSATMPVLFCGQADVTPRLLLKDVPATSGIESFLHFSQFLVAVVVDRDSSGTTSDLDTLGVCTGASRVKTGDCKFVASCVNFDLKLTLDLDTSGADPKLHPTVNGLVSPPEPSGEVCAGGASVTSDPGTVETTLQGPTTTDASTDANTLTPPIQGDGFTLNNGLHFINIKMIALDTDGDTSFQDYVGITGDIAP